MCACPCVTAFRLAADLIRPGRRRAVSPPSSSTSHTARTTLPRRLRRPPLLRASRLHRRPPRRPRHRQLAGRQHRRVHGRSSSRTASTRSSGCAKQPWCNGQRRHVRHLVRRLHLHPGGHARAAAPQGRSCPCTPPTTATPTTATTPPAATCRMYYDVGTYGGSMVAMNALPPVEEYLGPNWASGLGRTAR